MSVRNNTVRQIDDFDTEQIFTIEQLKYSKKDAFSVANALSVLRKEGYVKRLARRLYYKPRISSVTGNPIPLNTGKLVDYFATVANGYLTGTDVYRQMGFTTQMDFVYTIATPEKRKKLASENFQMKFVKAYCKPTENNVHLLCILDVILNLKNIPDCPVDDAIEKLLVKISKLSEPEILELVKCVQKYPPRARAVTGALLEHLQLHEVANRLKKNINPFSKFDVQISESVLPTKHQFNIV